MTFLDTVVGHCAHAALLQSFFRTFQLGRQGAPLRVAIAGDGSLVSPFGELLSDDESLGLKLDYFESQKSFYRKSFSEFDALQHDVVLIIGSDIDSEQKISAELVEHASNKSEALSIFYWGTFMRTFFGALHELQTNTTCLNYRKLFSVASAVMLADPKRPLFECGVFQGGLTTILGKLVQKLDERVIYAFDTFEGMPDPVAQDLAASVHYPKGFFGETSEQVVLNVLSSHGVRDRVRTVPGLIEATLERTLGEVGAPGFALLDMDSYSAIKSGLEILAQYYQRTRSEGETIVLIDDYGMPAVEQAVREVSKQYGCKVMPISFNFVGTVLRA